MSVKRVSREVSCYVTNRIFDIRMPPRQNEWRNRDAWWNPEEWKNSDGWKKEDGKTKRDWDEKEPSSSPKEENREKVEDVAEYKEVYTTVVRGKLQYLPNRHEELGQRCHVGHADVGEEGKFGINYQKMKDEETWNKNITLRESVEQAEKCRVVYAAESKK